VTKLLFIRHGVTAWNVAGKIQGRTDVSLSDKSRSQLSGLCLPEAFQPCVWASSPLVRAVETARLLGAVDLVLEPRLTEMDWGDWEGRTLAELRAENGDSMIRNEARGLDFRPPSGESPRLVQQRLSDWIKSIAGVSERVTAVTHKGVIRVALALATGWDMTDKSPHQLDWTRAHLFSVASSGVLTISRLNIPLAPRL
jgi:broad specificity phosphatase PhoE